RRSAVDGSRNTRRTPVLRCIVSGRLEDSSDRARVSAPGRHFRTELSPTARRERVVLRLPVVFGHAPLGVDGAAILEAMQGLVQRGVDDHETAAAVSLDPLTHGVAVERTQRQGFQNENVEGAVQEIAGVTGHLDLPLTRLVQDLVRRWTPQ